jgi:hypothetical protein
VHPWDSLLLDDLRRLGYLILFLEAAQRLPSVKQAELDCRISMYETAHMTVNQTSPWLDELHAIIAQGASMGAQQAGS